jgi:hypothetical protein
MLTNRTIVAHHEAAHAVASRTGWWVLLIWAAFTAGVASLTAAVGEASKVWTEPEAARTGDPDFALQGEYTKADEGLQVAAMGGGTFLVARLKGGLPGAGWDSKTVNTTVMDANAVKKLIGGGWTQTERKSPTLGAKPPDGAIVLFDGNNTDAWEKGRVTADKLLQEGTQTKRKFKNFTLHLEFMLPYKPATPLSNQDRGNSGVYIFNRYEVQLLESFGLHYFANTHEERAWAAAFEKEVGFKPASNRTQYCGSMYLFKTPALNAATPPLTWQTYDITFVAPKFEDGKKTINARISVVWNGIKVHDSLDLPKGTGAGGGKPEIPEDVICLQEHHNPIRFRNIWLVEQP